MRYALLLAFASSAGCGALDSGTTVSNAQVTYALDSFDVAAGTESFVCRYFPPSGSEMYIGEMQARLSAGGHHLLVYSIDTALGIPGLGQQACNQVDTPIGADAVLFASQEPIAGYPFPDGIGMHLDRRHGVYLQAHFLNATNTGLTAMVDFSLTTVDQSKVQQIAGNFALSNRSLDIPPGKSTQSLSCTVPRDMTVLATTGHMHRHGLALDGLLDQTAIYHGDSWDSPVAKVFAAPGLTMKQGQTVHWSCDYQNDTGADIHYGNSGLTDEMCILGGVYYPAPEGLDNTWVCPPL